MGQTMKNCSSYGAHPFTIMHHQHEWMVLVAVCSLQFSSSFFIRLVHWMCFSALNFNYFSTDAMVNVMLYSSTVLVVKVIALIPSILITQYSSDIGWFPIGQKKRVGKKTSHSRCHLPILNSSDPFFVATV